MNPRAARRDRFRTQAFAVDLKHFNALSLNTLPGTRDPRTSFFYR
jgi:hypothetical protein